MIEGLYHDGENGSFYHAHSRKYDKLNPRQNIELASEVELVLQVVRAGPNGKVNRTIVLRGTKYTASTPTVVRHHDGNRGAFKIPLKPLTGLL